MEKNTTGLHEHAQGIIAVTGLAHLGLDRGALYLVKRSQARGYEATYWNTLPSAPRSSGMLKDGSLFVACDAGDIVVKPDGRIEMAAAQP